MCVVATELHKTATIPTLSIATTYTELTTYQVLSKVSAPRLIQRILNATQLRRYHDGGLQYSDTYMLEFVGISWAPGRKCKEQSNGNTDSHMFGKRKALFS